MRVTVLGSGSTGNAVLIDAGTTKVLVDAGLSARELTRRVAGVGVDIADLDGILITHEHGDHAGGLRVLLKSVACPVFMSGATRDAYIRERRNISDSEPQKRVEILKNRVVEIESSRDFRIGEIDFHPFCVPHDAADNFGFIARHNGVKLATVLDFGSFTTLIKDSLRGCDGIIIESNHDRAMLKACAVYSWDLKQRILSNSGHISNEELADWLTMEFDGTARHIVLAHLSQRANEPHLARLTAQTALKLRPALFQTDTQITVSSAITPTEWLEF